MDVRERESRDNRDEAGVDEPLEEDVVTATDAISNPRAVVIEFLDAIIAYRAMF